MDDHPYDICACGDHRKDHPNNGPCTEYHLPPGCQSFRLACSDQEMREAEAEWQAMREDTDNG